MHQRLPLRIRLAAGALAVLLLAAVAAGTAVVRYGAGAVEVGGGESTASGSAPGGTGLRRVWFGIELVNTSSVAASLHTVRATTSHARVVEVRVLDRRRADGIGAVSAPLPAATDAALRPVEGFVLPPHSGERYQLVVQVEQVRPGVRATVERPVVTWSTLGLDHGTTGAAVLRIRGGR